MSMKEDGREVEYEGDTEKEVSTETPSERVHTEKLKKVRAEHVSPPVDVDFMFSFKILFTCQCTKLIID